MKVPSCVHTVSFDFITCLFIAIGYAYPLLCELARTLVSGVAEQFDDTALVGGEANSERC